MLNVVSCSYAVTLFVRLLRRNAVTLLRCYAVTLLRFYLSLGRHHKDPALAIAIAVEDDRSEVNMTYSLGTYFGGSDVVRMTVLRGPSAVVMKVRSLLTDMMLLNAAKNQGTQRR